MTLFQLTHGINREGPERDFAAGMAHTHVGQAHLAGTGPIGKTCRECALWSWKAKIEGWAKIGGPKPASCAKYRQLMREWGRKVPHNAGACRHFEQRDAVIPLEKPARVA